MGAITNCCSGRAKPKAEVDKNKFLKKLTKGNHLKDHRLDGDDAEPLSEEAIAELDSFSQFEKQFPFYKMDLNGFMYHLRKAQSQTEKEYVQLAHLVAAFENFESWSGLADPESAFVSFLS